MKKQEEIGFKIFSNEMAYLEWLNEVPRITKENDDKSQYVPISCVQEDLFFGYFGNTRFELLRETYHAKGITGIGRLHYQHPITKEWLFQDGSAAIPYLSGLHLDFPNLSSRVLLSCAKKIGKRFGRELNRDREDAPMQYFDEPQNVGDPTDSPEEKRMRMLITNSKTMQELARYKKQVPKNLMPVYVEKLKSLV